MSAPFIGAAALIAVWVFNARTDVVIGTGGGGLLFFLLAVYLPIAVAAALWLRILLQLQAGGAPSFSAALMATLAAVLGAFVLKVAKSAVPTGSAAYVVLTLLQWAEIAVTPGVILHLTSERG